MTMRSTMSLTRIGRRKGARRRSLVLTGLAMVLAPLTAVAQAAAPAGTPAAPAATPAAPVAPQAVLPGGAQAINETFEDWQMGCMSPGGTKRCAITQQQADSKTQQRLLAVELQPKGSTAEGVLLLPFGLALDKGITLKVGETAIGALRFKTCLPQGCIVPLNLDAKTLATLRASAAPLTVTAFSDAEQPVAFSVSVKGFGPALDRAAALGK